MSSDVSNHWQRLGYEQRLRDLEALIQVANQINRSLDPENVLDTSLTGVQSVLNADYGCFVLLNPDTPKMELARAENLPASLRARLEEFICRFSPPIDFVQSQDRLQIVSDIGHRLSAILKDEDVANSMLIPLLTRNRLIGILFFVLSQNKLLAPKSVDLLMSIGDQVAMAIENAWLHTSISESEKWHRVFIAASPDAIWESDASGRTTFVNDAACQVFGYDRATLLTLGIEDLLVPSKPGIHTATRAKLFEQGYLSNVRGKIRTRTGDVRIVGYTIRVVQDANGNFAGYQAILRDATEQLQVFETLQQRNEELAVLNSIAGILSNPLEISKALDQVCEQIISITGMETVAIYLIDESAQCLNLLTHCGMSEYLLSQGGSLGLDDPTTQQLMASGEPFVLSDRTYPAEGFLGPRADGYVAGISVPLRKQGKLIGTVVVGSKTKRDFGPSDVDLMQNISRQIGVALDNAELYAQMQQRLKELECLAQLSATCVSNFDVQVIAESAVESTSKLLPITFCSLRLLEGDEMRLVANYSAKNVALPPSRIPQDFVLPAVTQHIPIIINDVDKVSLSVESRESFLVTDSRAVLFVPLVLRERTIGMLIIGYSHPHEWQTHEVELMQTMANQVASAVNRAQLFQNVLSEQRKVQAIFDSGLSGLFATDAEGRIVMFNRAAERMTGWTLKEIQGLTWQAIFNDPSQTPPPEPLINEALLRKKTAFAHEGRSIRTRDGRVIPAAKAVAPLLDDKDNVTGAVGAFWDLSREQAAELEREEMLRFAAHQIRSPLTALLSALQLYARPNLSEDRRAEMWTVIMSQGERLRRFASQFLDFEAVMQSPRPLNWEPTAIVSTIRALVNDFRADPGKHTFVIKSIKPEPLVYADLDHLQHVLRNLIDNAVTYSPRESQVTISTKITENQMVEVIVKDQGPGVPVAEQEKIFKPFYRSPTVEGRSTYSHGLGLAIAHRLVKEMEGDIWVVSEVEKGAAFHFTLRRYR